jgi:transformation/transcription domain-associated protein
MLGSSPYLASTYKKAFDEDFGDPALPLDDVIALLQAWRTDLDSVIKRCPSSFSLESLSRFLAEFEFQRYDEVEVPGQYLLVASI